jgi:hypothetical protein
MTPPDGKSTERRDPPKRVRVTSPRASATQRQPTRAGTREIDEQTRIGEVYMNSLIHAQLRLALTVIGGTAATLGGLPLLFALVPASRTFAVLGLPLPWLLLGILIYPVTYLAARYYVRHAERIEAAFTEFVGKR